MPAHFTAPNNVVLLVIEGFRLHLNVFCRCLRMNLTCKEHAVLVQVCQECSIQYSNLRLPLNLTLWVDPGEVSGRWDFDLLLTNENQTEYLLDFVYLPVKNDLLLSLESEKATHIS